jgi:hypothetical protein
VAAYRLKAALAAGQGRTAEARRHLAQALAIAETAKLADEAAALARLLAEIGDEQPGEATA